MTIDKERQAFFKANIRGPFGEELHYREREIAYEGWKARAALDERNDIGIATSEWLKRFGVLLGEYAEAVSFDDPAHINIATENMHKHLQALLNGNGDITDDGKTRDVRDYPRGPMVLDEQKAGPIIVDNPHIGVLVDSAYVNGLGKGYSLGQMGDEERYQKIVTLNRAQISEAPALLSKYAAPAPKGEPSGYPCKIIEADFDAGTVLLQMDGRFTASAGPKFLCDAAPVNEQYPQAAEVCAELYQVVGSLASDLGVLDHPKVIEALDNASEHALLHTDVLPFPSFESPVNEQDAKDAQRFIRLIAWMSNVIDGRWEKVAQVGGIDAIRSWVDDLPADIDIAQQRGDA